MQVAWIYSFNWGREFVENTFPNELLEILGAIYNIDAEIYKTKESKEKTMMWETLYSPVWLNEGFKKELYPLSWTNVKEYCDYPRQYYSESYTPPNYEKRRPFRDMDFVKNHLWVEVQFGKYSFMVYNVCAKMTIFKKFWYIRAWIEVVPVKELADQMSTWVSYFEQFVWDLEQRWVSDIDIPVMIIWIAP